MLKKGVPQVSVIIPAYNAEKYIEESAKLRSENKELKFQTQTDKYKIIDTFYPRQLQHSELELLITKKLIQQHKGSIEIEATTTNGTKIKITLPATNLTS